MTAATIGTQAPGPAPVRPRHRLAPLPRLLAAAGGGILLYASFPPREQLWWLAPLALAALAVAVHGRRARAGFGYGYLFGVGFLGPLLIWVGEFVGPVATVPLVAFESLFLGLAGLGTTMVSR